jgi:type IV fimbrial biogenesis protein FimT
MHKMEKQMDRQSGFTLIEVAIVVAIVAIVSAIAIPNMIGSIANGRVNGAARDIIATIQKARIEAVKQNELVVVTFDPDGDGTMNSNYLAFVDDGRGGGVAADWIQNGTEATVASNELPDGVTISNIPFGAGAGDTRFNSRAIPAFTGPITLTNTRGYTVTINLGSGGTPTI